MRLILTWYFLCFVVGCLVGTLIYGLSDCSWRNVKNDIMEKETTGFSLLDIVFLILFGTFMLGGYLMTWLIKGIVWILQKLDTIKIK